MKANKGAALLILVSAAALADPPASNAETTLALNTIRPSSVEMISAREATAAPALVTRTIAETMTSVNKRLNAKIDTRNSVLVDSLFPAS